ncbi:L-threonylcarbamoyladenylate synthase [Halobellus limi]|uniref:L-threonylcarbamoyladenylate synthase n=1 Tax=Halobellus limi TaxID=699433 RepID=A0A1H5VGC0_9EURY|nr:L-threonylcarbamoyladenylate synthase [Halobellus limi]QCC46718.1 threonylcarbamoyl-AMP synthase [Halobellus limi]SEF86369.1 translation factor SUA5 [Halobellus limi]
MTEFDETSESDAEDASETGPDDANDPGLGGTSGAAAERDLDDAIDAAADAIGNGEAVVYPTETVYGLGADATDPAAVERVFEVKGRDRSKPLSLGVPSVDAARRYSRPSDRALRFMRAFLPGPVTVVVDADPSLPEALTAGRDRVGIRIPDHEVALALFERVAPTPVTATSANVSGSPSVTDVSTLDPGLRDAVAVVVDAGPTPGTESTVVDPERNVVHRRGAMADAIVAWLEDDGGAAPTVEDG